MRIRPRRSSKRPLRELFRQQRLAHARRPHEEEHADGAAFVAQAGPRAENRLRASPPPPAAPRPAAKVLAEPWSRPSSLPDTRSAGMPVIEVMTCSMSAGVISTGCSSSERCQAARRSPSFDRSASSAHTRRSRLLVDQRLHRLLTFAAHRGDGLLHLPDLAGLVGHAEMDARPRLVQHVDGLVGGGGVGDVAASQGDAGPSFDESIVWRELASPA